MIRGALLASTLAGCWTGTTPTPAPEHPPVRPRLPAIRSDNDVAAILQCDRAGKPALVLHLNPEPGSRFEAQLVYSPGTVIPMTFLEGYNAELSICAFHGCADSWIRIDSLELGVGARGHYHVVANAGPTWDAPFEAVWTGTPWAVRPCPYDMNPP